MAPVAWVIGFLLVGMMGLFFIFHLSKWAWQACRDSISKGSCTFQMPWFCKSRSRSHIKFRLPWATEPHFRFRLPCKPCPGFPFASNPSLESIKSPSQARENVTGVPSRQGILIMKKQSRFGQRSPLPTDPGGTMLPAITEVVTGKTTDSAESTEEGSSSVPAQEPSTTSTDRSKEDSEAVSEKSKEQIQDLKGKAKMSDEEIEEEIRRRDLDEYRALEEQMWRAQLYARTFLYPDH